MHLDLSSCTSISEASDVLGDCLTALGLSRTAARLHLHSPASQADAWCEPGIVHLRPPARQQGFWSPGGLGRLMLAHEAVHAAQFSADLPPARCDLLEQEAEALAPQLAAGSTCSVRRGAAPGRLHWGRAGHYYTLYLAGLVAGADDFTAQRMAFYGQVPDLVSEFDAPTQAAIRLNLLDKTGESVVGWYVGSKRGVEPADPEVCCDVIEGLHCLTGGSVTNERRRRRAIQMGAAWGTLEFGIALHAFGDAYAHAFRSSMFGHDYGHAIAGHWPDEINMHQQTYKDYYNDLLGILMSKVAKQSARRPSGAPSADQIAEMLDFMAKCMPDGEDEPTQIPYLRDLICEMSGSLGSAAYQPADDCIPWADFIKTPAAAAALKPEDFAKIMGFARAWRLTPRDPRPASVREQEIADRRKRQDEIRRAQWDGMREGYQP